MILHQQADKEIRITERSSDPKGNVVVSIVGLIPYCADSNLRFLASILRIACIPLHSLRAIKPR